MRFGLLYEHQLPRPWDERSEHQLFKDALAQVELADRLGIHHVWEVEHHFLEEYSHSSAPEVFLAAVAARTKHIRLGHGVVLSPPGYNHPARVAERIATLDLISGGRVEWGTGESASRIEIEGFGVDPEQKKAMWAEAVEQTANMMAMSPYPGFQGQFFSMPCATSCPSPTEAASADLGRLLEPRDHPRRGARTASARWPSPSSIRPRRAMGATNITRSSSPSSACRSAIRSTPTSPW